MASDKPLQRAPLMSLDEALSQVLAQGRVLTETEHVAILDADGRFLAEDLISALQVPPQDNSAMDGYAVRIEDLATPGGKLEVKQRIPAGQHGHARGDQHQHLLDHRVLEKNHARRRLGAQCLCGLEQPQRPVGIGIV